MQSPPFISHYNSSFPTDLKHDDALAVSMDHQRTQETTTILPYHSRLHAAIVHFNKLKRERGQGASVKSLRDLSVL